MTKGVKIGGRQRTLEDRIAALLASRRPISKKMFGGICFMLGGHMIAGTFKGQLLVRVGKEHHAQAIKLLHASSMQMGGRVMSGYVVVAAEGLATDKALQSWLDRAIDYVGTLPPKMGAGGARKRSSSGARSGPRKGGKAR